MFPIHNQALAMPERLDLATLPDLREAMLARRGADLDLDASGVVRIGAQALQLILAGFETWRHDGFRLRLVDPSDAVLTAFVDLGCEPPVTGSEAAA